MSMVTAFHAFLPHFYFEIHLECGQIYIIDFGKGTDSSYNVKKYSYEELENTIISTNI